MPTLPSSALLSNRLKKDCGSGEGTTNERKRNVAQKKRNEMKRVQLAVPGCGAVFAHAFWQDEDGGWVETG